MMKTKYIWMAYVQLILQIICILLSKDYIFALTIILQFVFILKTDYTFNAEGKDG